MANDWREEGCDDWICWIDDCVKTIKSQIFSVLLNIFSPFSRSCQRYLLSNWRPSPHIIQHVFTYFIILTTYKQHIWIFFFRLWDNRPALTFKSLHTTLWETKLCSWAHEQLLSVTTLKEALILEDVLLTCVSRKASTRIYKPVLTDMHFWPSCDYAAWHCLLTFNCQIVHVLRYCCPLPCTLLFKAKTASVVEQRKTCMWCKLIILPYMAHASI